MFIDFLLDVFENKKDETAIIYKEKEYSYKWLLERYQEWTKIIHKENIPFHSVVSVQADFNPKSIALLLALIEHGCVLVPFSPAVKNPEELMEIAEVQYNFNLLDDNDEIINRNRDISHNLLLNIKDLQHPGLVLFSSGTTGKPKGALHDMALLLEKFKVKRKPLKTITFLLFDHIGGFNTLMHILSNGGTIVAPQDRSPDEICRLIEKYQVQLLPTSPTFINMILFSRAYEKYDVSSLKLVTYGTEPMPKSTLENFNRLFPNIQLKQTYGLSELGIMRSKSESSNSLWLKVGGEDYETKIVDGKLWIKAKTAMLGYLNAPSPFTEDGWFNTDDRVETKGEYIKFLGRESEIINVGGEKVYPIEVESVLLDIDGVKDAAVKGEKHPLMGNIVVANIKVDQDNNNRDFMNQVKKICREKLEKYKIPVKMNLTEDDLNNARYKRQR